jgi:predicted TPR repeat methyltransferase
MSNNTWLKNGSRNSSEVEGYYDDWAETYDDSLSKWHYRAPEYNASILKKYLDIEGPVYDAGCGTGLAGRALKAAGFKNIVGSDISSKSVQLAADTEAYSKTLVLDLQEFPFPFENNYFAGVNCVGVMTYIEKIAGLFKEFTRITRPGGVVAFTHRDDMVEDDKFISALKNAEDEGLWEMLFRSEPEPYLPQYEAFSDKINVIYFAFRVL